MSLEMYRAMIEERFSAAHQLRDAKGKPENLHGHNWKVQAAVTAKAVDEIGLVLDFRKLKAALQRVLLPFEHAYLNEVEPFTRQNPSSENIARWIYDRLVEELPDRSVRVARVTVWESEDAGAAYGDN
jgi:6-pyruvoyltetrahydropterin/6-carboxytetrahydropterin synthase